MNKTEHRDGVSEANLVIRHLKLNQVTSQKINRVTTEIDSLYGLDSVSYDQKSKVISLAYDATRISIDGIEELLLKHELEVAHDWWTHFKEGYYRFVDQNVSDNAHIKHHCCNKPPQGINKK